MGSCISLTRSLWPTRRARPAGRRRRRDTRQLAVQQLEPKIALAADSGTPSLTPTLVKDINTTAIEARYVDNLTRVGSTLYFTANDGVSGYELWKTDGTEAGTVRVADIRSGSGSSYPSSLTAVGSTLYFTADDGVTGNNPWSLLTTGADATAPTVTITDDVPGMASGPVTFTFTFSEPVTGFTADKVVLSSGTKGAFTAESTTVYRLVVSPPASEVGALTVSLAAGAGSDSAGNPSLATSAERAYDTRPVVPPPPPDTPLAVLGVTPPAPGAYRAGQRVSFAVTLSEAVQVKGKPQIQVRAGTVTRTATYVSGSGSPVLTFQYTVGTKDNAPAVALGQKFVFAKKSSIAAGSEKLPVNLPAGIAGAAAPGVRLDAAAPKVVGRVVVPGSGTSTVGQALDFVVRFSEVVIVNGTPQIGLTGLTAARQAAYVSGSGTQELTFRYVVQAGDALGRKKTLGLAKSIALPGGASITDEAGNRAAVKISAPSLKGVTIDTTTVAAATLSVGGDMAFTTKRARAAAFATLG